MTPSAHDTIRDLEVLGDCWIPQRLVTGYLGISRKVLRARNQRGQCLPHYIDPATGRRYWRKRRLDLELEHATLADFSPTSRIHTPNAINSGRKK
jgi:hypothetical protein